MFYSLSLKASEDVDIYSIEVPVANQSISERNRATKLGLNKVLIRASGLDTVIGNQYIQANIDKANSFIQQFAYKSVDVSQQSENQPPWILSLSFESKSVQRLLADSGLPVWGKRRPLVLLWIAEQNEDSRMIVGSDSVAAQMISSLAAERAIPFSLPLMDLEDATSIDITDVWGRFSSPVELASRRYGADVIVFGRIYAVGDEQWQADWQFILEKDGDRKRAGWSQQAQSKEQAYTDLISELGRRLCSQYCVMSTLMGENEMQISVSNINNFADAVKAEKYLQGLLAVRTVDLHILNKQGAIFKLKLVSRKEDVLEAIALDSMMLPLPGITPLGIDSPIYNFSWTQ